MEWNKIVGLLQFEIYVDGCIMQSDPPSVHLYFCILPYFLNKNQSSNHI